MQRQRIRFGAVVVLGRHHLHLGQILERFVQRHDAGRLVTVVVGDEDFHAVDSRWIAPLDRVHATDSPTLVAPATESGHTRCARPGALPIISRFPLSYEETTCKPGCAKTLSASKP
ncbi:hypothetical protein D9M68_715450 [compost metagenome]